jgi:hypothetical protein
MNHLADLSSTSFGRVGSPFSGNPRKPNNLMVRTVKARSHGEIVVNVRFAILAIVKKAKKE